MLKDAEIIDEFVAGFSKQAEAAGVPEDHVLDLLKLAIDLAQTGSHPEEFIAGFREVVQRQ